MPDFTNLLVGLAGLAAVAIVVFAHDWREEYRQECDAARPTSRGP